MPEEVEVEVEVEETTDIENQEQEVNISDNQNEDGYIGFDLPNGLNVKVRKEDAEKWVEERKSIKERTKLFNELNQRLETEKKEKIEAIRKAQALEAAKNDSYDEAESLFNQKLNDKISKYHNRIVDGELKTELLNHPEFLGSDALDDALTLIKSSYQFDLDDDSGELKIGDKDIKTVVDEFVKSKAVFRKATRSNTPFGTHNARPTGKQVESVKGLKQLISESFKK